MLSHFADKLALAACGNVMGFAVETCTHDGMREAYATAFSRVVCLLVRL